MARFDRYAAIKERLVAAANTAMIGVDDDISQAIADRLDQRRAAGRPRSRRAGRSPAAFYADGERPLRGQ